MRALGALFAGLYAACGAPPPRAAPRAEPWAEPVAETAESPVELTLRRAEKGDAEAQFRLGAAYETGVELPPDLAQAVRWYRLSAEQGCAPAQLNLGLLYFEGRGVQRDHALASAWLGSAADQGLARAQYALASLLRAGDGVARDEAQAARWLQAAAEQGRGVPEDCAQAAQWFARSAQQGFAPAQAKLGALHAHGGAFQRTGSRPSLGTPSPRKAGTRGRGGSAKRSPGPCPPRSGRRPWSAPAAWPRRALSEGSRGGRGGPLARARRSLRSRTFPGRPRRRMIPA